MQRALDSLVRQTCKDFEVVVILDQCWKRTASIVAAYKKALNLNYFKRPRKQNAAICRNFGLKHCKGDWIALLDADDQWVDKKLKKQRAFLLQNPQVDICGTLMWDLHPDGSVKESPYSTTDHETHDQIVADLETENCICHGSVIMRRSMLETLGGYPEDRKYLGMEDWALWKKAMQAEYTFHNIPERLYIYSIDTSVPRGEIGLMKLYSAPRRFLDYLRRYSWFNYVYTCIFSENARNN